MTKLDCKIPKPCLPTTPIATPTKDTPSFSFCAGNLSIRWDGKRLHHTKSHNIQDGTYDTVTVVDGCIVGYGEGEVPTYTPPYCNPNPSNCQQGVGGTNTTSVSIAPLADNTLTETPTGLYARTYIQQGSGVQVTGGGTKTNPYTISVDTRDVGVRSIRGSEGVEVSELSSGVVEVTLNETSVSAGTYNGFSVNKYGQITGVDSNLGDGSIQAGLGIEVTETPTGITIAHPEWDVPQSVVFGGYAVTLNNSGHITEVDRLSDITPGTYTLGAYLVQVNEYGGIQDITQSPDVPKSAGEFLTSDGRRVKYDDSGRITEVKTTSAIPLTIRDFYRITRTNTTADIETYGTPLGNVQVTPTDVVVPLAGYITSPDQVVVNGATSYTINTNSVTIQCNDTQVVTVVYRG